VLAAVAAGGMIGAALRYGVTRWIPIRPGRFPWATFWVNVTGSFVLGVLLIVLLERYPDRRHARPFLATGVLGGFTTMSSYAVDIVVLGRDGHVATAAAYATASMVGALALAAAGVAVGWRLVRAAAGRTA
jgi:CrcB protein